MSRYTGPTTKINRRFGMALFPENKAMQKKPYIPGQHGPHLRRRVTDYSMGLNEKQKLRFMFGLSEKQFRLTFERAKKVRGVTGEIFMQMLETRLDNVIYSLGFARTRKAARQFVTHGHVQVRWTLQATPASPAMSWKSATAPLPASSPSAPSTNPSSVPPPHGSSALKTPSAALSAACLSATKWTRR